MFSSGGYFRGVNCPFFVHGLCHRPYCHFRHAKPGHGSSSKNTTVKSCLKSKSTATASSKSASEGTSSSKSLIISDNKESSLPKTPQDPSIEVQEKNTITKNNTNSASILKDEVAQQQIEKMPESKEEKEIPIAQAPKKTPSILDSLNKLEQAVEEASASLFHCSNKQSSISVSSHSKDQKMHSNITKSSLPVGTSKIEQKSLEVSDNLNKNTQGKEDEILENVNIADECQQLNPTTENDEPTTSMEIEEPPHSSKVISSDKEMSDIVDNVTNIDETSGELSETRTKSAEKEASSAKRPLRDQSVESDVEIKKRKSLDSKDVPNIQKAKSKKQHELKASVKPESKVSLESKELKSPEKKKISSVTHSEEKKNDSKQNSALKKQTKPKQKLKAIDIDFFSAPKKLKSNKIEAKERTKHMEKDISEEDRKAQKGKIKLKTLRNHSIGKNLSNQKLKPKDFKEVKNSSKSKVQENVKQKSSVPLTTSLFESDDEVRFSSDSLSDSDSETDVGDSSNEMLKEIFDNYDPLKDSIKKQAKESLSGTSVLSSIGSSPVKNRPTSSVNLQGLSKKPRVAHNASYLVQRKSSNLNPVRRVPKTIASITTSQQEESSSKEYNLIQSKKRVAHTPKPTSQSSVPRPRIPIEYGAKVPQSFRQRYLDKIIDEHLRLCSSEKDAFEKAVEEERSLYNRSTRRHMYLNLCINAINKLRSHPTPEFQPESTVPHVNTVTATVTNADLPTATETKRPKKIDTDNLSEEMFYDLLSQYILSEEELVENGFPRTSPTSPGKVTFKSRKAPSTPNKDPNRRICCRCGRRYTVREDGTYVRPEECHYHVGRLLRRRTAGEVTTTYSCCGGDGSTPGCAVCKVHVCEGKNVTEGFMTTIVSPLAVKHKRIYAIDCEMCYTIAGLELTRVTVVDWKLEKIYDTFVRPDNPVLDYNTRFSGVTEECLRGVRTSIREVQAVLLSMLHKDSILVGHSLESDLLALKLVHSTIVDTSVVFPHRLGPPYKRALRTLTAEFLKQIIQDDEAGHDSYEDAKASLELMLHKAKEDLKKKERSKK